MAKLTDAARVTRLAVLTSHPIQYYAPLFRELARRVDLMVYFANRATPADQARAGFGTNFEWDVDLTSGYAHTFLGNTARRPGTDHFAGCDTPEIGLLLREERCDALLVMGWHLKSYLQGVVAAKRMGLPVMVRGDSQLGTPRSGLKQLAKALAYPHLLRRFDAALYVGERSRAYYLHYGYPSAQLFFSPHCVDTDWFCERATLDARNRMRAELSIAPETPLLLFAGKLVPFKRPLDLVAAAARCRDRGVMTEVLVAGDGELREPLTAAANDARVPLHLLGFCNQTRMPAAYVAGDVLVLPSDARETWGLVANEALACGRPVVVSSDCGCAPDLVADGQTGRMYLTGDVGALAGALSDVLARPPTAQSIAARSRRHSVSAAADGIQECLEHLRAERGRSALP